MLPLCCSRDAWLTSSPYHLICFPLPPFFPLTETSLRNWLNEECEGSVEWPAPPQNINIHHRVHRQRKLIIISQRHGRSTCITASLRCFSSLIFRAAAGLHNCSALDWMRSRGASSPITPGDKQTHRLHPFLFYFKTSAALITSPQVLGVLTAQSSL